MGTRADGSSAELVARKEAPQLESWFHMIRPTDPRQIRARRWIVDELTRRHRQWASTMPTRQILRHLEGGRLLTRAERLRADACAEVLRERHPEARAAEEQWVPGDHLEVYTRGPAPRVLAALQHTHG